MRIAACSLGAARARRARLRRRQIAVALALAALSAAFWGAASGSAGAATMTFVSLALHAAWSARGGERFLARAALSYLFGGTWAALDLIVRYRLPH
jgi:hypothetical protein